MAPVAPPGTARRTLPTCWAAPPLLLQPRGGACLAAQLADHAHDALGAAREDHGAREATATVLTDGDIHLTGEAQRGGGHALRPTRIVHLATPLAHRGELVQQRPRRPPPAQAQG